MLKGKAIQLKGMETHVEEECLIIRVKVFNPESRTLYAYGNPRRILYDNATGRLTLYLHDQHLDENSLVSLHLRKPRFVALEGQTETDIKISIPKVMKRLKSAAERGGGGSLA